jgi:hypothetical protein
MDPGIAQAFANSTAISRKLRMTSYMPLIYFLCLLVRKGTGANLLKVGSKRRRTRQEILDFKSETKAR